MTQLINVLLKMSSNGRAIKFPSTIIVLVLTISFIILVLFLVYRKQHIIVLPFLPRRAYSSLSEAFKSETPVRIENAQGSKPFMFSIFFTLSYALVLIDSRLNLPSIGMTESMPTISTRLDSRSLW